MSSLSRKFISDFRQNEFKNIMNYYKSFLDIIFPLYHLMLKQYKYSFYKEYFFTILEYLYLILFIFSDPVSNLILFLKTIVFIHMEFKIYESNKYNDYIFIFDKLY